MEDTRSMTLGKRILYYRKCEGLTQDQLAERMGVSPQAVSKWEHDLCCPDVTALPRLAEIFHISTDALLGLADAQPQQEAADHEGFPGFAAGQFKERTRHFNIDLLIWAAFFVALGGVYLTAIILDLEVSFWSILWPMCVIFVGFSACKWELFSGAVCALAGFYFLLSNLGMIAPILTWSMVIGVALVLLGIGMLGKALFRKQRPARSGSSHAARSEQPTRKYQDDDGFIRADYAFCSDRITVRDAEWNGGKVEVAFGSLVVDLQSCQKLAERAQLHIDIAFGSLLLILPRSIRAEFSLDRAASSFDESGTCDPDAAALLVTGDCAFSSLKVQYV